jgi:acetyltransferase
MLGASVFPYVGSRRFRIRRGVGYLLMERLIDVAGQRGIGELVGEVLRENEPMLQMCRELGFAIASESRDPAVMLACKKLPEN